MKSLVLAISMLFGVGDIAYVVAPPVPSPNATQMMETHVQDPNNPDEPWIIITYRKDGESPHGFTMRHQTMVEAVRDALGR